MIVRIWFLKGHYSIKIHSELSYYLYIKKLVSGVLNTTELDRSRQKKGSISPHFLLEILEKAVFF